jgi:hypothetical protein
MLSEGASLKRQFSSVPTAGTFISVQISPSTTQVVAGQVSEVNVKHGGGASVQDFETSSAMHFPAGHEAN